MTIFQYTKPSAPKRRKVVDTTDNDETTEDEKDDVDIVSNSGDEKDAKSKFPRPVTPPLASIMGKSPRTAIVQPRPVYQPREPIDTDYFPPHPSARPVLREHTILLDQAEQAPHIEWPPESKHSEFATLLTHIQGTFQLSIFARNTV